MLDRMESLAKQGARDQARQALNDLRNMLENLQNADRQQADPETEAQQRQLDRLQDMIREQSKLRDKTFQQYRRDDRAQRDPQGRRQQDEDGREKMRELAEQQKALRERLDEVMKEMRQGRQGERRDQRRGRQEGEQSQQGDQSRQQEPGRQGQEGTQGEERQGEGRKPGQDALGQAGESMGQAQGSLGQGQTGDALDQQQQALESLRKGAQALSDAMQGKGKPGRKGEGGEQGAQNGEEGRDDDPLGRPTKRRESDGATTKVPGEIDAERARRVLDELRRRLGDSDRSREELDYIERLLTP